jgi:hypothetical protein
MNQFKGTPRKTIVVEDRPSRGLSEQKVIRHKQGIIFISLGEIPPNNSEGME